MIMNDATASACRELIARGRGENHNPTGTAIVNHFAAGRRPANAFDQGRCSDGLFRGAHYRACPSVVFPCAGGSRIMLPILLADHRDSKLDFLAGRIVAPESSKLHSSRYPTRKLPHL